MSDLNKDKTRFLDKLVSDCITFGLHPRESLEYIKKEYGEPISERTFQRRRKRLLSDKTRDSWFSHFTRIGFVELYKKLMDGLEESYNDTMHQLFIEQRKNPRNEVLIIKLKTIQLEHGNQLSEMSLGTPIIAGMKAKLEKLQNGEEHHGIDYYYRHSNSSGI